MAHALPPAGVMVMRFPLSAVTMAPVAVAVAESEDMVVNASSRIEDEERWSVG